MARFSVFIAVSIDGCIARADGSLDWLDAVQRKDQDYGYQDFADSVDAVVFGRTTFEVALGFGWPYAGKRAVVLTRRPLPDGAGVEAFSGDVRDLAARLAGCQRVYVDGGQVIRAFLAADLIDDMTLSVIPVLLGDGIRLFAPAHTMPAAEAPAAPARGAWRLTASETFDSGLVQLRYQRAEVSAAGERAVGRS